MAKSLLDVLSEMTTDDVGAEKTAAEVESYAEAMADCDYRDLEKLAFDLGLIADEDGEEKTADEDEEAEEAAEEGEETDEDAAEVDEDEESEEAEGDDEESEAEEDAEADEDSEDDEAQEDAGEEDIETEAYTLTPDEFEKCAYEFLDTRMKSAGVSLDDYVTSVVGDERLAHDIAATSEKLAYVMEASPFKVADDILTALHEKIASEYSEDEE